MATIHKTQACSHAELNGVGSHADPAQVIVSVCNDAQTTNHYGCGVNPVLFSFYVFSQAQIKGQAAIKGETYGDRLSRFITENKLGTVIETESKSNLKYHSQHHSKVFIWTVDHAAVNKWYKDYLKTKTKDKLMVLKVGDFSDELDEDLDYEDWSDDASTENEPQAVAV